MINILQHLAVQTFPGGDETRVHAVLTISARARANFPHFSQSKLERFLKQPVLASKPTPPLFPNGQALQKPSSAAQTISYNRGSRYWPARLYTISDFGLFPLWPCWRNVIPHAARVSIFRGNVK